MSRPEDTTWGDLLSAEPAVPQELLRWWLSDRTNSSLTTLPLNATPSGPDREAFALAVERLNRGEPVQYVCGRTEFRNLTLHLTHDVLIPRPETEQLVQWLLDLESGEHLRVLDVGTGSGCIACSLKQERPHWQVEGTDISDAALQVAINNAQGLNLEVGFRKADLLRSEPDQSWDVVISNPPYIGETERPDLPGIVKHHEPELALFSGTDGLNHIRSLLQEAPRVLKPKGNLLIETGETQTGAIAQLARKVGLTHQWKHDLAGRERFHLFRKIC